MNAPIPEERILPTLNNDGSRRWIRPKQFRGRYYWWRFATAWALVALFVSLPLVQVGGKPAILLDVPLRRFHLFGATYLPTDGVLLMLLLLSVLVAVFLLTAVAGRVWCGWGCPQTVYMEFLFRPLEQLLEGSRGSQLRLDREGPNARRVIKWAVFLVLSVVVGNIFLAYFVGVERLSAWVTQSPLEHPTPFAVMAVASGLAFFDFSFFREQMCTIVCPYARLQSVLLDRRSLVVGYDRKRGEPRRQGKRRAEGDCIDCKACVVTCPTGIDIRDGLQLECVACTQCMDACDKMMKKVNKPTGLIRYTSQVGDLHKSNLLRPRVLAYAGLLSVVFGALVWLSTDQASANVTVLRGVGAPFVVQEQIVRNQLRVKVHNRGSQAKSYHLELVGAGSSELVAPENPLNVAAGQQLTTTVFVLTAVDDFESGVRPVEIRVVADGDFEVLVPYKLLGPRIQQQEM